MRVSCIWRQSQLAHGRELNVHLGSSVPAQKLRLVPPIRTYDEQYLITPDSHSHLSFGLLLHSAKPKAPSSQTTQSLFRITHSLPSFSSPSVLGRCYNFNNTFWTQLETTTETHKVLVT